MSWSSGTPAHVPMPARVSGVSGKVCPFYRKGYCRYKDNCWNMHIADQGRSSGTPTYVPVPGRVFEASGKVCPFYRKGYCRHENNCWNMHIADHGYGQQNQNVLKPVQESDHKPPSKAGCKTTHKTACRGILPPPCKEVFIRQPLPDRYYDLSPLDPNVPYILLSDDVLIKILEYLPLKKRIICEIVCRRWQALLYIIIGNTTHMDFSKSYLIKNSLDFNRGGMLSKMLLLKGKILKSLSFSWIKNTMRKNFFYMIAQLCPNLECLNLLYLPALNFNNVKDLKDCKNLKSFSIKGCEFNEHSFKKLISLLPYLEKIDIRENRDIIGDCFDILPKGLKELNISYCSNVPTENLRKISKACKNLEVLHMEYLDVDEELLEELAVNCISLKSLALPIPWFLGEISSQIKLFTKLIRFKSFAQTFELANIAENVKDLEELHLQIREKTTNMVEFGKFAKLKNVFLEHSPFRKQELMSLEKCKSLQYVTIKNCKQADQETIEKIVKGCPKIKHINCPKVCIDIKLINNINKIMKNRLEPIKISVHKKSLDSRELLEAQYDTKKIDFQYVEHRFPDEESDDDLEEDDDDDEEEEEDDDDNDEIINRIHYWQEPNIY